MVRVILNDEQARLIQQSLVEPVQLCDAQGKVLRRIDPLFSAEEIAAAKKRARSPGPWYSGAQVQARLRALQEEWDRTGGFDQKYMQDFLARLNAADPGEYKIQVKPA